MARALGSHKDYPSRWESTPVLKNKPLPAPQSSGFLSPANNCLTRNSITGVAKKETTCAGAVRGLWAHRWSQQTSDPQAHRSPAPSAGTSVPGVMLAEGLHGGEELDALAQGHRSLLLLLRLRHAHVLLTGLRGRSIEFWWRSIFLAQETQQLSAWNIPYFLQSLDTK